MSSSFNKMLLNSQIEKILKPYPIVETGVSNDQNFLG